MCWIPSPNNGDLELFWSLLHVLFLFSHGAPVFPTQHPIAFPLVPLQKVFSAHWESPFAALHLEFLNACMEKQASWGNSFFLTEVLLCVKIRLNTFVPEQPPLLKLPLLFGPKIGNRVISLRLHNPTRSWNQPDPASATVSRFSDWGQEGSRCMGRGRRIIFF